MTEGKSDFEKCLFGNILSIRVNEAIHEVNLLKHHKPSEYTRSEDQLYVFHELFGRSTTKIEPQRSEMLDAATSWLLDNDMHGSFELVDITYEYQQDWGTLPVITGFTLKGCGIFKNESRTFILEEAK